MTPATFSLWSRNILLGKDDIQFNKWLTPLVHLNTAIVRRLFELTKFYVYFFESFLNYFHFPSVFKASRPISF